MHRDTVDYFSMNICSDNEEDIDSFKNIEVRIEQLNELEKEYKEEQEVDTIEVSEDCIYVDNGKKIERAISRLMQSGIQATFHDKDTKRAVNDLIHAFKSALSMIPSRPKGE